MIEAPVLVTVTLAFVAGAFVSVMVHVVLVFGPRPAAAHCKEETVGRVDSAIRAL